MTALYNLHNLQAFVPLCFRLFVQFIPAQFYDNMRKYHSYDVIREKYLTKAYKDANAFLFA
jgi:hypothetical protein